MAEVLTPEELALLDRVAVRVADLGLETPAILTIETARPLSVIAGQAMLFFEPIVQMVLPMPDWRRFAMLVERREALEALTRQIETRADEAHARRRAGRAKPQS